MTSSTPSAEHEPVNFLQLEVETMYAETLDRYGRSQDAFFGVCAQYAGRLSGYQYDAVEEARFEHEADLAAAIRYTANSQPDARTGIAHAHGFIIAADAIRVDFFCGLAPQQPFVALGDSIRPGAFERTIRLALIQSGFEKIVRGMARQAVNQLQIDTEAFRETVATGRMAEYIERAA